MSEKYCAACGGLLEDETEVCPHCGHRLTPAVPRQWILIFFVMGIVLGLILLNLEQAEAPWWLNLQWINGSDEPAVEGEQSQATTASPTSPGKVPQPAVRSRQPANVQKTPSPSSADEPDIEPRYCDRNKAWAIREKARSLATISEQGEQLLLRLSRDWEYYNPGHRRGFIEAFAEADLCLREGRGRTIRFSYRGKEVATVSAEGAVEMK